MKTSNRAMAGVSMTLALMTAAWAQAPVGVQPADEASRLVQMESSASGATYRLLKAPALTAALSCGNSLVIKIVRPATERAAPVAEGPLIASALAGGQRLVLTDARCDADGSIVASGVSVEPQPSAPTQPCLMPYAREKLAECR
jgi:hypothetical protein